ncbi:2-iminobutanoate/2-iminopropanoate deaminase [Catalinimonas alkaloidigena]|uniref:2-iminobutanoate/2-iminopropanoate deaminase n=1 Tax=Catalinimonas alkaloidigena TaxID=1075417 RepID=A0A1G9MSG4_9BACT|nr:RidA family protein [Catalinimonas alkaloidigena]SDL77190.1 2-iminobutanoate/2-iminopropanoate deaminase [Catalinimonas alkaloidigena]
MQKEEIHHPDKTDPNFATGAFSAGVKIDGWLYVSGQAAVDFAQGKFVLGTIEEETRLTLHNIRRICEAAGASLDDVVKCTVYLADINDFPRYNTVYAEHFTGVKPARTTVEAAMANGIKVEIDAIVRLPE